MERRGRPSAGRGGRGAVLCAAALLLGGGGLGRPPAPQPAAPPPAHTGGFGEPTCLACHFGDELNAYGGSVRVEGLPDRFAPGRAYVLTVHLQADGTAVAGFQLAARFSQGARWGRAAGVLRALDGRVGVTHGEGGQPYAHQTSAGSLVADVSGSSWTVEWTAPAEAAAVVFHVAANSGNGDNSPLGDLVYAAERTVPSGS